MTAIPDRVSIERTSKYFFPNYKGLGVRIDGVNRPGDVHEFCVSKGWADVRARNEKGQFRIDGETNGYVLERVHGLVEPFWKFPPKGDTKTAADAERMQAAEEKRQRKAEKLRKQMGA